MAASDARPIPIKNTAFRVVFPILDADGDLVTGATGLDSEVSKDQGTFADCTNEATEIATSSGMYYLDLTSTEMNADCVAVIVKTTSSGAKTTTIVLYPEETGDINVDVTAFGGAAGTFASGRPEVNVSHWKGTAAAAVDTAGYPKVTIKSGTGTGEVSLSSGKVILQATQTGVTIPTVTTLTNAPSDSSGVTTLLSRLSATRAGYLDNLSAGAVALEASVQSVLSKLLKYFQLALRKDSAIATDNATELTAINANGGSGGGAFANTTDAQEAIRDNMGTAQTGDAYARLGAPAGASVSADVAAVKSDTAAVLDDTGTSGVVVAAASKTGYRLSSTGVQDIWDALTSALTTASSIGKLLVDNINATISSRLASSSYTAPLDAAGTRSAVGLASANLDTQLTAIDDYIDTEVAAIKAKTDLIPASPAATSDIPSAATIADAVWDEALSGHTTAGSGGKALSDIDTHTDTEIAAIKAKTDNLPSDPADASDIAALIDALPTAAEVRAEIDSNSTQLAAIVADTNELQTELADGGRTDLLIDAIKAKTDNLPSDPADESLLEAAISAVWTTAMTESYNADGSAPTPAQALFVIMQRLTEFAISGTTVTVKKLDGSTTAFTETLDDATNPTSQTRAT